MASGHFLMATIWLVITLSIVLPPAVLGQTDAKTTPFVAEQAHREPPAHLPFRFDSAVLENHWYGAVGRIADTLHEHPQLHIVLVGHTDLTGSHEHNRKLSQRRATYVAELLINDFAIAKERIRVHGAGDADPLETSVAPAVNAKNRRVEVLFTQG